MLRSIVIGVVTVAGYIGVLGFEVNISKAKPELLVPAPATQYFTFGYRENVVDSFWLRTVQDLDMCEQSDRPMEAPSGPGRIPKCHDGWVSQMLDRITQFAPRFRDAYLIGATMLTIVVDDRFGASRIFDRAVARFPNDWEINFRAAYHYMLEEGNKEKAAAALIRAGQNGAPEWVFGLAGNLQNQLGQAALAFSTLTSALERVPLDSPWRPNIEKRLAEVRKKLELAQ